MRTRNVITFVTAIFIGGAIGIACAKLTDNVLVGPMASLAAGYVLGTIIRRKNERDNTPFGDC